MRLNALARRMIPALVLAALALNALPMAAQSQYPPNSMALAHNVVVIGPNSPGFDMLLEKWFPGVTGVNYFQQVKPLLAIVHNNTKRVVKAYVVKWAVTNADSSTSSAMLPVMSEPGPGEPSLPGSGTVLGPAGTGLGTQLVSPFFHWPRKGFSGVLPGGVQAAFMVDARYEPLVSKAGSATSVQATLDGAIFGDGVFVGPDSSMLYERFQAEQQAEFDEAAWMLSFLQSNPSVDSIKAQLSQQIYEGRNSMGTDRTSLYRAARGRAAEGFLADLEQLGEGYVNRIAMLLSRSEPVALQRLSGR